MTSPECGLRIGAKCWLSGNREGRLTLFHSCRYPHDVIGPITFMWKPSTEHYRTLWLWSHPAFYEEILTELIDVFKLTPVVCDDVEMETEPVENVSTIIKLKNVPVSKAQRFSNSEKNIVVSSLKNTMNRFRLCGPLSNSVLCKALHPAVLFSNIVETFDDKKSEEQMSAFQLLDKYSSPSHFPSHSILGSCIIDPRLHLKRKRNKAIPSNEGKKKVIELRFLVDEWKPSCHIYWRVKVSSGRYHLPLF